MKTDHLAYINSLSPDDLKKLCRSILPPTPVMTVTNPQEIGLLLKSCKDKGEFLESSDGQFSGVSSEVYLLGTYRYEFLVDNSGWFQCCVYNKEARK